MGLNKHRNKPCQCGSGKKFKHCHLRGFHYQQSQLVTEVAKQETAKEQRYWKKRYDRVTSETTSEGE